MWFSSASKALLLAATTVFGASSGAAATKLRGSGSSSAEAAALAAETSGHANRLAELAHAIEVLQDAGVDFEKVDWGRKPTPERKLIGAGYLIRLKGVDIDSLTPEEKAFAEDAVAFAFNEANKDSDYTMRTSHLMSIEPAPENDNGAEEDAALGGRKGTTYTYIGSNWGCSMCRSDRFFLGAPTTTQNADGTLQYNRSPIVEAWEDKLAKVLQTSRFESFQGVDDLSIDVDYDLSLATVQAAAAAKS